MRHKGLGLWAACFLILGLAGSGWARMSDWEAQVWGKRDVPGKMELVSKMFYDGRAADAADGIQKLLGEGAPDKEIVQAIDKLTPVLREQMLANPATTDAVKKLIERVETALAALRQDQAYIDSVVAQVKPAGEESWIAVGRCGQLGEYAVPALVGALATSDDARTQVTLGKTLVMMGPRAVRPLAEGLRLDDPAAVVQVCNVLGEIRNDLALGALAEQLSDKRWEGEKGAEVRRAAAGAMVMIEKSGYSKVKAQSTAAGYYFVLADAYLHKASFTLPTIEAKSLPVWNWSDTTKKIAKREVPAELYAQTMAEKMCADGLRTDKSNTPLRGLLLSSLFAQKLELTGKSAEAAEHELELAILVGGEPALYGSMTKSETEGDAGLAILAAQTLAKVTTGKGVPEDRRLAATNPLLAGLESPYRTVRFASAQAIVAEAPTKAQGTFEEDRMVLAGLSWGLMYELPAKCVLVAHTDEGVVGKYRGLLTAAGYRMTEALTTEALLAKAAALPKPDVIMLDAGMIESLASLRAALADPAVRIILIAGADTPQKQLAETYGAQGVVAVVGADPGEKEVTGAIALVPKAEEEAKLVALLLPNVSQKAAETLASIKADTAPFKMGDVVPALRAALAYKNDAVLAPTLKALGNIGATDATADVLKVAAGENSKTVKVAALGALAAIFEVSGDVSPDVFGMLVPLTDSDDADVALAASKAVMTAKFNAEQFADLVLKKRVQAIKAGVKE